MIILRQKEYNLVSDIEHSGIKRALRKNIGRVRVRLANKVDKSIENDLINKRISEKKGLQLSNSLHKIPETINLAETEIKNLPKIGVSTDTRPGNFTTSVINDYSTITVPQDISLGELNHELGHIKNHSGDNGKLAKLINKKGQTPENNRALTILDYTGEEPGIAAKQGRKSILARVDPEILEEVNKYFESAKLSDSSKRYLQGKMLVQDEKNASKWSLKRIKNELSPEVFNLEKERQRVANDSYRYAVQASSKIPIRNKIQIPSRRGDFKFRRLEND